MKTRITRNKTIAWKIYFGLTFLNIALFSFIYYKYPALKESFTEEGFFLENLTLIVYLIGLAAAFFFISKLETKNESRIYRFIPFVGLVCLLRELDFGFHLFKSYLPAANNFHALRHMRALVEEAAFGAVCIVSILLIVLAWKYRQALYGFIKQYQSYFFVLLFIVFIFVSQALDLRLIDLAFLSGEEFIEELLEFNGALALLFAAFFIRPCVRNYMQN
ncbi:MAG: hypothetical protein GY754_31815 [bacterium]|nr:hypothetical protein [bacterium]